MLTPELAAKCKARGVTEVLHRVLVSALNVGDEFVKPGFLQVYAEDSDGYANLSAAHAGERFRVTELTDNRLKASMVSREGLAVTGESERSQIIPRGASVLKVEKVK